MGDLSFKSGESGHQVSQMPKGVVKAALFWKALYVLMILMHLGQRSAKHQIFRGVFVSQISKIWCLICTYIYMSYQSYHSLIWSFWSLSMSLGLLATTSTAFGQTAPWTHLSGWPWSGWGWCWVDARWQLCSDHAAESGSDVGTDDRKATKEDQSPRYLQRENCLRGEHSQGMVWWRILHCGIQFQDFRYIDR